jgi:hypothetical protein
MNHTLKRRNKSNLQKRGWTYMNKYWNLDNQDIQENWWFNLRDKLILSNFHLISSNNFIIQNFHNIPMSLFIKQFNMFLKENVKNHKWLNKVRWLLSTEKNQFEMEENYKNKIFHIFTIVQVLINYKTIAKTNHSIKKI